MSIAAVVIITCLMAAIPAFVLGGWYDEIRDPRLVPDDVVSRVKELSGPKARACGTFEFKRHQSRPEVEECIAKGISNRSAFWIVTHGPGMDSIVWYGLASNSQGKVWEIILDTDVTGTRGPPDKPVMTITRCVHPTIRERRLDCENWHRWD